MYSAPALYDVAATVDSVLKAVLLTTRICWFATTCTTYWRLIAFGCVWWRQVELGAEHSIVAVVTQGRHNEDHWVTQYKIAYKRFAVDDLFSYAQSAVGVTDGVVATGGVDPNGDDDPTGGVGDRTVFNGNQDSSTLVRNEFAPPIIAQIVRLEVVALEDVALRWALYGCNLGEPRGCCCCA